MSVSAGYFAATTLITGSAAVQNLMSLENPAGSTVAVIVRRIIVDGVVVNSAATPFLYRMGRTTALPTVGTVLTSQKRISTDAAATAIARQAPTATAAAGDMNVAAPGVVLPGGLLGTPLAAPRTLHPIYISDEQTQIVLSVGEGLLVRANANDTDWSHYVCISWEEGN